MRIHYKDGTIQDILISQIDSLTFVEKENEEEEVSLIGSWLWANKEAGYYELLTFNEDHTYIGYDKYFSIGFDIQTYGWFSQYGTMLTLQSNGFGYRRRYNWYIKSLTDNAFEVMTNMGVYTYYKLQQETIYIQESGTSFILEKGDHIVFADGVIVKAEGNKIVGLFQGTTYVLLYSQKMGKVLAYKVIVK